jgi:hypothetical protein
VQFDLFFCYRIKVARELIGVARGIQARAAAISRGAIENVGKSHAHESGKHRVNEIDEEILRRIAI